MKIEILLDKETLCEFDVTEHMLLKLMYKFIGDFESNEEFINRMSKK